MRELRVGLLNDSFPPSIDGVANVTLNYARIINSGLGKAVVATPKYPDVVDDYPFEVVRYPSAYVGKEIGFRAGIPYDPATLIKLDRADFDIIHSHCPLVSTLLARNLRVQSGAPIVFTYHTKFDIDINKITANDSLRRASVRFLVNNINACDAVWVVSKGAGENLRSLGYEGDYSIVSNGVDFERKRADADKVAKLRAELNIADDETVFLFVGRMMWYKGVRLSLDALASIKARGCKFRFILVGDGHDRQEMEDYVRSVGLEKECCFTGAIRDRELLRVYFTLSDLFLFPSDFDTNGIVVREAAACYCPSLLLEGSCAAEGVTNERNGIVIGREPEQMIAALQRACADRNRLAKIGENAANEIYISWNDAVKDAYERYFEIIDGYHQHIKYKESTLGEDMRAVIDKLTDEANELKKNIFDRLDRGELIFRREMLEHKEHDESFFSRLLPKKK